MYWDNSYSHALVFVCIVCWDCWHNSYSHTLRFVCTLSYVWHMLLYVLFVILVLERQFVVHCVVVQCCVLHYSLMCVLQSLMLWSLMFVWCHTGKVSLIYWKSITWVVMGKYHFDTDKVSCYALCVGSTARGFLRVLSTRI